MIAFALAGVEGVTKEVKMGISIEVQMIA